MPLKATNSRRFKVAFAATVVGTCLVSFWLWHRSALPDRAARSWLNRTQFNARTQGHQISRVGKFSDSVRRVDKFSDADWQYLFHEGMRLDTPREIWLMGRWSQLPPSLQRWLPRPNDHSSRRAALAIAWEVGHYHPDELRRQLHPDERRRQLLEAASQPGLTNQSLAIHLATDAGSSANILLPELGRLAADGDLNIRRSAMNALMRIDPTTNSAVKKILIQLTKDADPLIRLTATVRLKSPEKQLRISKDEILAPAP